MRWVAVTTSVIWICGVVHATSLRPKKDSTRFHFHSRPDIDAPKLNISLRKQDLLSPGYMFFAPQRAGYQVGPYIYDDAGSLIWGGNGDGLNAAHGFHVCDYNGKVRENLCLFQGEKRGGYARGHNFILNNEYQVVKTVSTIGGVDMHEFHLVDEGTKALITSYSPKQYDISDVGVDIMEWLQDGIFKEIDLATGKTVFEWHSVDHVRFNPGNRPPFGPEVLNSSSTHGFDYFHINSIDKNAEGDYLVSSRNTNSIYKVSGLDGHIIWRLSRGSESSFRLIDFVFTAQHHARWVSETPNSTILSFLDNADNGNDGDIPNSPFTSGVIILLDHVQWTATLLKRFTHPLEDIRSVSQGSVQILPNGNVFIGWGNIPTVSEHLEDGTPIYCASMETKGIYRAFKSEWHGHPVTPPDLWSFARTAGSTTALYVSWNGATEVESWNFYVGETKDGVFTFEGNERKKGFETLYIVDRYSAWTVAEAVGIDGKTLARTAAVRTWVPRDSLALYCTDLECPYEDYREMDGAVIDNKEFDAIQGMGELRGGSICKGLDTDSRNLFTLFTWPTQFFVMHISTGGYTLEISNVSNTESGVE